MESQPKNSEFGNDPETSTHAYICMGVCIYMYGCMHIHVWVLLYICTMWLFPAQ